jgi:hypothetical protein
MCLGHQHHAGVTPGRIHGDHAVLGTQRDGAAERGDAHVHRHRPRLPPHQPADRQVAQPAHILRPADRLAPQVEAPGGEGVAEEPPHAERRHRDAGQHRPRHHEVARGLEREQRHRERRPDHRGAEGGHAHHGEEQRVHPGQQVLHPHPEQLAEHGADQQGGEEQPATEAAADRDGRRKQLEHEQQQQRLRPLLHRKDAVQQLLPGGQDARFLQGQRPDDEAAKARPQHRPGDAAAEAGLHQRHPAHEPMAASPHPMPSASASPWSSSVGGAMPEGTDRTPVPPSACATSAPVTAAASTGARLPME